MGHVGVAVRHAALEFRRAGNGVGDALELDQHAVAGGLDDAALVLGDGRIDQLQPRVFSRASVPVSSTSISRL